jgi:uracil-DNA glycosylase
MRGSLFEPFKKPAACAGCPEENNRRRFVPGTGELDECENLVVAEQPGENEDREGEPLVGNTGKQVERACGGWAKVFRTNVRKCIAKNKDPKAKAASIAHCVRAYLVPEIERVCGSRPPASVVLTLIGGDATRAFLGIGINKFHGSTFTREEAESIRDSGGTPEEEDDTDEAGVAEDV